MTDWEHRLEQHAPLGQVLHIGAGRGGDLATYLAAGARRLVLVEPDPQCFGALRALVRSHPEVEITLRAEALVAGSGVAEEALEAPLHRFNFGAVNSLLPPGAALKRLFPGLRPQEPETVPLCRLDSLMADLDLTRPGSHVLVLEAAGMALEILTALAASEQLEHFHLIRVREGREPLYDGAASIDQIRGFLAEAGFASDCQLSGDDPEWPWLEVTADAPLRQRVSKRRYEALQQDYASQLAAAEDQAAELRAEREAAQARLTAQEATAAKEIAGLTAQVAALKEQQQEHEAREKAIVAEREQHKSALQANRAKMKTLEQESRTGQQNLAVALRMQMMREADLKDLQQRYSALLAQKEAQEDLLQRVSTSLGYLLEESRADAGALLEPESAPAGEHPKAPLPPRGGKAAAAHE